MKNFNRNSAKKMAFVLTVTVLAAMLTFSTLAITTTPGIMSDTSPVLAGSPAVNAPAVGTAGMISDNLTANRNAVNNSINTSDFRAARNSDVTGVNAIPADRVNSAVPYNYTNGSINNNRTMVNGTYNTAADLRTAADNTGMAMNNANNYNNGNNTYVGNTGVNSARGYAGENMYNTADINGRVNNAVNNNATNNTAGGTTRHNVAGTRNTAANNTVNGTRANAANNTANNPAAAANNNTAVTGKNNNTANRGNTTNANNRNNNTANRNRLRGTKAAPENAAPITSGNLIENATDMTNTARYNNYGNENYNTANTLVNDENANYYANNSYGRNYNDENANYYANSYGTNYNTANNPYNGANTPYRQYDRNTGRYDNYNNRYDATNSRYGNVASTTRTAADRSQPATRYNRGVRTVSETTTTVDDNAATTVTFVILIVAIIALLAIAIYALMRPRRDRHSDNEHGSMRK